MQHVFIFFVGLIVHMNLDNSNTAVLIRPPDNSHAFTMTIIANGTAQNPISIDDSMVTINRSPANLSTSFAGIQSDVPHLGDMAPQCSVRDVVNKHNRHPFVATYVTYEGGVLTGLYDETQQARFGDGTVWQPCQCMACVTELEITVPVGTKVPITLAPISDKTKTTTYSLANNDVLVIRDEMQSRPGPPPAMDHSHLLFSVLDDGANNDCAIAYHVDTNGCLPCAVGVDCSNAAAVEADFAKRVRTKELIPFWAGWSKATKSAFLMLLVVNPSLDCSSGQYP